MNLKFLWALTSVLCLPPSGRAATLTAVWHEAPNTLRATSDSLFLVTTGAVNQRITRTLTASNLLESLKALPNWPTNWVNATGGVSLVEMDAAVLAQGAANTNHANALASQASSLSYAIGAAGTNYTTAAVLAQGSANTNHAAALFGAAQPEGEIYGLLTGDLTFSTPSGNGRILGTPSPAAFVGLFDAAGENNFWLGTSNVPEAILRRLEATNLVTAIADDRAAALSNLVYAIGTDSTNRENLFSVALSNLSYTIGTDSTNRENLFSTALSNLCYVIGANATNYAAGKQTGTWQLTNLLAGGWTNILAAPGIALGTNSGVLWITNTSSSSLDTNTVNALIQAMLTDGSLVGPASISGDTNYSGAISMTDASGSGTTLTLEAPPLLASNLNYVLPTNQQNGVLTVTLDGTNAHLSAQSDVTLGTVTASSFVGNGSGLTNLGPLQTPLLSLSASASNAPAQNELPTAGWVRELFAGSAMALYETTNLTVFTNTDATTPVYAFSTVLPSHGMRSYSAPANGEYIGSVATTNRFTQIQGPLVVNAHVENSGGTGLKSISIHPEVYYSYDGTNWFGDWESADQFIASGLTNLYQWVISVPNTVSTNADGFYVLLRFKVGTQSGGPDIVFHQGTNTASHIDLAGPNSAQGNAFLAANQTFTGSNTFTGTVTATGFAGSGVMFSNAVSPTKHVTFEGDAFGWIMNDITDDDTIASFYGTVISLYKPLLVYGGQTNSGSVAASEFLGSGAGLSNTVTHTTISTTNIAPVFNGTRQLSTIAGGSVQFTNAVGIVGENTYRILGGTTLAFVGDAANWTWPQLATAPTNSPAGKIVLLTIAAFGGGGSNTIGTIYTQP